MEEQQIIGRMLASYPDFTTFSENERAVFDNWIQRVADDQLLDDLTSNENRSIELAKLYQLSLDNEISWNDLGIETMKTEAQKGKLSGGLGNWQRYIVAASVLLMLFAGAAVWFNFNKRPIVAKSQIENTSTDILPGHFGAKLTLSSGAEILLDSAVAGKLTVEGNTTVVNKNGELAYLQGKGKSEVVYNTLTTTTGQTYATVLGEGTKIWINSSSKLRFPVSFIGDSRRVEITGEAYFEVAKGTKPFIVSVNGMEVEVLGTHFNINAYDDEQFVKTTLLEGRVKVKVSGKTQMLKPGEQAELQKTSAELIKKVDVDTDQAVAWRYGFFQFNQSDLKTVMRQIARWYNLEIEYKGKVSKDLYAGEIPRNAKLSTVLKALQTTEVHFTIQGKKLIIE